MEYTQKEMLEKIVSFGYNVFDNYTLNFEKYERIVKEDFKYCWDSDKELWVDTSYIKID